MPYFGSCRYCKYILGIVGTTVVGILSDALCTIVGIVLSLVTGYVIII